MVKINIGDIMKQARKDMREFMSLGDQTLDKPSSLQAARYINHIIEEAQEFAKAIDSDDFVAAVDSAVDLMVVCIGFLESANVPADQAWDIVMDCNLSKVDGRFGPPVFREDGQIGKPHGWKSPEARLLALVDKAIEGFKHV